jgi:hypothetical protein
MSFGIPGDAERGGHAVTAKNLKDIAQSAAKFWQVGTGGETDLENEIHFLKAYFGA